MIHNSCVQIEDSLVDCIHEFSRTRRARYWLFKNASFEQDELISELYIILRSDRKFFRQFAALADEEGKQRWVNHGCNFAKYRIANRSCNRPCQLFEDVKNRNFSTCECNQLCSDGPFCHGHESLDQELMIASLSADQQEVIKLRLDGWNQSEIATALGISRRTVYRRLDDAAKSLGYDSRGRVGESSSI